MMLTLAAVSAAAAVKCPGSPAPIHAQITLSATASASCSDVIAEIKARVDGQASGTWHDPHNNGKYSILSAAESELDLSRVTGNGKYTDKQVLTFSGTGSSCTIEGCSQSQVTSVADMSTNYCDLRMLYCGSADGCKPVAHDFAVTEDSLKPSIGAGTDKSACLKTDLVV
mmetsp:Transcript_1746/g.2609  ORF Transcript_1746/g.2609 Transcript_1746/m.2609 type:complete len:170 (+) Transcript_1746:19-528(+)